MSKNRRTSNNDNYRNMLMIYKQKAIIINNWLITIGKSSINYSTEKSKHDNG